MILSCLLLVITGFNLIVGGLEARWRLYGWRTPEAAIAHCEDAILI